MTVPTKSSKVGDVCHLRYGWPIDIMHVCIYYSRAVYENNPVAELAW